MKRLRIPHLHANNGFTLLETVLAIVLLAVLLGAGYSGLRAAAKAMASGEVSVERTNRLRVSQEFMRHQISRILPLPYDHDDSTGENKIFEGTGNMMRFVAPMPGYLSHGGAYVQTIELKRAAGNTLQLYFSNVILTGYDAKKLTQSDLDPQVLIDQVKSGRFEYRTYNDQGELGDWTEHWKDSGKTPVMVRIHLEMAREALVAWPDMQIALVMDGASGQQRNGFIATPRGSPLNNGSAR
jgi:general secretion pathway protein J